MRNNLSRRLTLSFLTIVLLVIALAVTTFALVLSILKVEDNLFQTGEVSINLNDGEKVIDESEFLFEPGITVRKPFFVENESPIPVYYRLYFDNIRGGLAKVLDVTVLDAEDRVLYQGKMTDLTDEKLTTSTNLLSPGQRVELYIEFYFPTDAGNANQGLYLVFNMYAEAVQARNNPQGIFD